MARKKDFKTSIQETVNLPSRGIAYDESLIPTTFNMRPMTVNETKIIYGSGDVMTALDTVLQNCIDVEDFPITKLLLGDKLYLSYQLRALTFGENYDIRVYCPTCKKAHDVTLDLTQIEIDYAPDDFQLTKNIGKLPVSGDEIVTKVLTVGDYENVTKRAKEIKDEYPDYQGDPFLPLAVAAQISTVNDRKMNSRQREEYATNMHAMDELYFSKKVQNVPIGPKPTQHVDCPECGKELNVTIRMGEDFFRPSINFD